MNTADNLRTVADALRATLADYDKAADAIRLGTDQRDALSAEIESDTAALNLDDPAALQLLAAKKSKLDIIKSRIPNDEVLSPLIKNATAAARQVPDALRAFITPIRDQIVEDICENLKSVEPDLARRRQMAFETPTVRRFHTLGSCGWSVFEIVERPIETARKVLTEVSAILAGEKPWLEKP